jgi:hypothetical protein
MRCGQEVETREYLINQGQFFRHHQHLKTLIDGQSAKFPGEVEIDYYHDPAEYTNEIWSIKTPRAHFQAQPTRNKCQVGNHGFIPVSQDYTMAGYTIMEMRGDFRLGEDNYENANIWISHDWGQIPSGKYRHQRFHLRFPEGLGAEVYTVSYDQGIFNYLTYQYPNGHKVISDDVEIVERDLDNYMLYSEKLGLSANLTWKFALDDVAVYNADLVYRDQRGRERKYVGSCISEIYDLEVDMSS